MTPAMIDPDQVGMSATPGRIWLVGTLLLGIVLTLWHFGVLAGGAIDIAFDEGQYWGWSKALAFGYYSKPPMVAWAIAATTGLCGDGVACVKSSSALFHLGTGLAIFFIGRRLFDPRVGFFSAVIYWSMPGVVLSSFVVSTDPPLLFFWSLALLAWARLTLGEGATAHGTPGAGAGVGTAGWWTLLGVAIGFGLLSKYAMLFFVLGMGVHMAVSASARAIPRQPGFWLAASLGVLLYLPNLYWNYRNGFVSYAHTRDNANLEGALFHPDQLGEFLGGQFAVFGPLLFLALLGLTFRARTLARTEPGWALLLSFSVPVIVLISVQALLSRAHANWAATAYVAACVLVASWLLRQTGVWRWVLPVTLVLHLGIMAVGSHLDPIVTALGIERNAINDPLKRVRGWREAGQWAKGLIADHRGVALMLDERKTQASLVYHARPEGLAARRWHPGGAIVDHYALTMPLTGQEGKDFILITRRGTAAHVAPFFQSVTPAGRFQLPIHKDYSLVLDAYLCRGFKGYAP